MKFEINKNDLIHILSITQNIAGKKTSMPILVNVLVTAKDEQLIVSATDLEIAATASAPAKVNQVGSTTVNAKIFFEIVKELPEGNIKVVLSEGERIEISNGLSKAKIIGVSAEEYPGLPGIGVAVKSKIKAKQLLEMINKTSYAVSQDDARFNLCGVNLELGSSGKKDSTLKIAATDGHRIAVINRIVENLSFSDAPTSVILPKKGLPELTRILEQENDFVGIDITGGFFIIEAKNAKIAMRLVDGEFPDFNKAMPKDKGETAIIDSQAFNDALKRASLLVSDKAKGVRVDFYKDKLVLFSSSPELGEAKEELEINFSGKNISIGFNARYILDFLASLEEKQNIVMEIHGEKGPAILRTEKDEAYTAIVMPMRL